MINLNSNSNSGVELSNIDRQFINTISNKITLFGQIPYNIPPQMIIEVIKDSARIFYKFYNVAIKQTYYVIKKEDIIKYSGNDSFLTLIVNINPKIRLIKEVYEANTSSFQSISSAMYETAKYNLQNDMYGASVNNNMFMVEATIRTVEARALDNILSSRYPFDYSPNTHELILKRPPKADLVLDCYADNDISSLYNDAYFERHVLANTKKELKRLLGGHTFNLPGGITISAEEICNNIEDSANIEELIKKGSNVGDIILRRR